MFSEKELLIELNKLKEIKPAEKWQTANRQVLLNQISNYQTGPTGEIKEAGWFDRFSEKFSLAFAANYVQPVAIVIFIGLLVCSGGFFSVQFAKSAKPGDSLYIAKIISEKTQLALTFNERGKAELGIQFANNRAEELNKVLAEPGNENKQEQVDQLVNDFRNEINSVRTRLEKINPEVARKGIEATPSQKQDKPEENPSVFSANVGKDASGLQLGDEPAKNPVAETTPKATTSTPSNIASTSPEKSAKSNPQEILEQAKDSLSNNNYNDTLDKLDEASNVIGQVNDSGQVKGISESATTTNLKQQTEKK